MSAHSNLYSQTRVSQGLSQLQGASSIEPGLSQAQTASSSTGLSLRNRNMKISSFAENQISQGNFKTGLHSKTSSVATTPLNSTQPMSFGHLVSGMRHNRAPSMHQDHSRNRLKVENTYHGSPSAATYSSSKQTNSKAANVEKIQIQRTHQRGSSAANLLAMDSSSSNIRNKWLRQSKSPSQQANLTFHNTTYIRHPGPNNITPSKYVSPPLSRQQNAASTTSKKNYKKMQQKSEGGAAVNDYRALLERQRNLIRQINNTQKIVDEKIDAHNRVNSADYTSQRIHSFLQTHKEAPYYKNHANSPTAQAAVIFQEKYRKSLKKAVNSTVKTQASPEKQQHSPHKQVPRAASAAVGKSQRRQQEEEQRQTITTTELLAPPEVEQVRISYQNFINHPRKRSPRAISSQGGLSGLHYKPSSPKVKPQTQPITPQPVDKEQPPKEKQQHQSEAKIPAAQPQAVPSTPKVDQRVITEESERKTTEDSVSVQDYIVGKQIGQGAYAVVKLGFHKLTNKKVAIKIYEKFKLLDPQRRKSVRRQIKLMEKLRHANIIQLYEAIDTSKQVLIVMEYMGGLSLHGLLKSRPHRRLDEPLARRLFSQVVSGIAYCHSKSVTHRDIKLENILLDPESRNLKIIDFGFSTCIPNDRKIKIFCGTPSYMAPEIVSRVEYAGPPADIWALGVLLYAMLCGCFPFRGSTDKELYKRICRGVYHISESVPTGGKILLSKIFQVDPSLRPTAQDILRDPWLQYGSEGKPTADISIQQQQRRSMKTGEMSATPKSSHKTHDFYKAEGAGADRERELPPQQQAGGGSTRPESGERVSFNNTSGGVQQIRNSGNIVHNNFNIINNVTHITCPPQNCASTQKTEQDVVSSLVSECSKQVKLGYRGGEDVRQSKQGGGLQIKTLYDSMVSDKAFSPVAPSYVPSFLSSLSPSNVHSFKNSSASKLGLTVVSNNWMSPTSSGAGGRMFSQERVDSLNLTQQNINLMGSTPFKTRNTAMREKENVGEGKGAHGRNKTMFAELFMQL